MNILVSMSTLYWRDRNSYLLWSSVVFNMERYLVTASQTTYELMERWNRPRPSLVSCQVKTFEVLSLRESDEKSSGGMVIPWFDFNSLMWFHSDCTLAALPRFSVSGGDRAGVGVRARVTWPPWSSLAEAVTSEAPWGLGWTLWTRRRRRTRVCCRTLIQGEFFPWLGLIPFWNKPRVNAMVRPSINLV